MILIADSGSTKTDWRILLPDNRIEQARTDGLNPNYQHSAQIRQELTDKLLPQLTAFPQPAQVFFYGAGCSTPERKDKVKAALAGVFPEAQIEIEHDLLAAARALCGHQPGIACILGTGTNSCLFDGKEILDYPISLGFWLGDEGSGGYLGKQLVKEYLNGDLPAHLSEKFARRYPDDKNRIIDKIYTEPFPNRYLASFSKFLFDNRKDPYIHQMITDAFQEFFRRFVQRYPNHQTLPIHIVGSVGFYYADLLRRVAKNHGLNLQRILETPIAGLTLFHQELQG